MSGLPPVSLERDEITSNHFVTRERSEAIQGDARNALDCFVASLLAMTIQCNVIVL